MWGSGPQPIRGGLPGLILVSATCILALWQPLLLQGGRGLCQKHGRERGTSHPGLVRHEKGAWDAPPGQAAEWRGGGEGLQGGSGGSSLQWGTEAAGCRVSLQKGTCGFGLGAPWTCNSFGVEQEAGLSRQSGVRAERSGKVTGWPLDIVATDRLDDQVWLKAFGARLWGAGAGVWT